MVPTVRGSWKCRGRRPGRSCWRSGSHSWAPAWRRVWSCPRWAEGCSSSDWAAGSGNCSPVADTRASRWSRRHCVRAVTERPGTVDQLRPGMAGHRFRLPEKVHPISAGVKGGIVGGLVMPIPALAYGLISGHGLWFPINLLAGMVIPGAGSATARQLEQFSGTASFWRSSSTPRCRYRSGSSSEWSRRRCPRSPEAPWSPGGLVMPLLWTWLCTAPWGSSTL